MKVLIGCDRFGARNNIQNRAIERGTVPRSAQWSWRELDDGLVEGDGSDKGQ